MEVHETLSKFWRLLRTLPDTLYRSIYPALRYSSMYIKLFSMLNRVSSLVLLYIPYRTLVNKLSLSAIPKCIPLSSLFIPYTSWFFVSVFPVRLVLGQTFNSCVVFVVASPCCFFCVSCLVFVAVGNYSWANSHCILLTCLHTHTDTHTQAYTAHTQSQEATVALAKEITEQRL